MQRDKTVAVALAVASIVVIGMIGLASAGGSASWNTNEPIEVPEDGTETLVLTVHDDIEDESVDEVATVTPSEGIDNHVDIEQTEIRFGEADSSERIEVVVDPDLEEGETAEGSLILEHGQETDDGISTVGVQYAFDLEIEATEPEGGLLSGASLLGIVGAGLLVTAGAVYGIVWRRKRDDSSSGDSGS